MDRKMITECPSVCDLRAGCARPQGRIPRTLEVDLSGALIDAVRTGDLVTVVGIVKARTTSAGI